MIFLITTLLLGLSLTVWGLYLSRQQKADLPLSPHPASLPEKEHSAVAEKNLPFPTIPGYYLIELLGQGGFARVYLARHLALNRYVAIKVSERSLLEEARLLSNLSHPSLPRVFDCFLAGRFWYLVMEYIPGPSLQDDLEQRPELLSVREVLRYGIQLCDVLAYLHRSGVAHCDLKPGNLVVTVSGQLYLLDFGLATVICQERGWTPILGTRGYLSPQRQQSLPVTPQDDIYSLGVTLWTILAGKDADELASNPPSLSDGALGRLLHLMMHPNPRFRPGLEHIQHELRCSLLTEAQGTSVWSASSQRSRHSDQLFH